MPAALGTIPALPPYQPGALRLTGQELVEVVSSASATSAVSGSMLITDVVGKAPSAMTAATPAASDQFAFFQAASGTPRSVTFATFGILSGNVVIGGTVGQVYVKNSATNFDAGWTTTLPFLTLGTAAITGTATVGGNIVVTGTASLGAPLSVANGGTNTSTLTSNGVVYGAGAGTVGITAAGGAGTVLLANNGAPFFSPFLNTVGFSRISSNFGVVSSTTLVNIGSLTAPLASTTAYFFRLSVYVTAGNTGGTRLAINASQAVNSVIYDGHFSTGAGLSILAFGGGPVSSLAGPLFATTAVNPTCMISGTIVTNSSCTLTPQIAQVVATTTTTLALAGSIFEVYQVA